MKKIKMICIDGTAIDFEVEDTIQVRKALENATKICIGKYNNKTIIFNINNISFIEIEN